LRERIPLSLSNQSLNNPVCTEKPARNAFRRFLVIIAVFILLIVGFYLEEDVKGKWEWSQFKRTEEANGEKFTWSEFIPPPVPDDQNFAMTPLLRAALDYTQTTNGPKWHDTNAYQHLMDLNPAASDKKGFPELGNPEEGALADLKAAADFYRNNPHFPQSATPENDGEVILAALNKFAPDLDELRQAAAARPFSRFPIQYDSQPPAAILLPHLAPVKGICMVCELRAVAELQTHRPQDAFADLQLVFRMSDSIRDEPVLIDHLVRIAILNLAIQGIREGIARHAWTESQLLEFETQLAKLDLLAEYEHTMRGERALNLSSLDYIRRHGASGMLDANATLPLANSFNWLPSGWYYQNMSLAGTMYRDYILPAIDQTNRVVSPGLEGKMTTAVQQLHRGPYNLYAVMFISALAGSAMRPARTQTWVDEARIACALERYRLEHHDLPDSLEALRPQFMTKLPHDVIDGLLLRYRKNTDGTYVIYSIGWNERDDGGSVDRTGGSSSQGRLDQGDWVWKFPVK
jgi:hypothetical protein